MTNQHHSSGLDATQEVRSGQSPLDRWRWAGEYAEAHKLTPPQAAVLSWMAHYGIEGLFKASQQTLMKKTRLSERAVRDALKVLRAIGAAIRERESKGKWGHDGAAHYRLVGASTGWYIPAGSAGTGYAQGDSIPAGDAPRPAGDAGLYWQETPVPPAGDAAQVALNRKEEEDQKREKGAGAPARATGDQFQEEAGAGTGEAPPPKVSKRFCRELTREYGQRMQYGPLDVPPSVKMALLQNERNGKRDSKKLRRGKALEQYVEEWVIRIIDRQAREDHLESQLSKRTGQRGDTLYARAQESGKEITMEDFEKAFPEVVAELEMTHADADFDVRTEIEQALGHEAALKWYRTDLYVSRWLKRERTPREYGRNLRRGKVETDWTKDFLEGTE